MKDCRSCLAFHFSFMKNSQVNCDLSSMIVRKYLWPKIEGVPKGPQMSTCIIPKQFSKIVVLITYGNLYNFSKWQTLQCVLGKDLCNICILLEQRWPNLICYKSETLFLSLDVQELKFTIWKSKLTLGTLWGLSSHIAYKPYSRLATPIILNVVYSWMTHWVKEKVCVQSSVLMSLEIEMWLKKNGACIKHVWGKRH